MENTGDIHFLWAFLPVAILLVTVLFATVLARWGDWERANKLRQSRLSGIFKQWTFGEHTIDFQNYSLWIWNGRLSFKDYESRDKDSKLFLEAFTYAERNALWKEYKNELRERVMEDVNKLLKM